MLKWTRQVVYHIYLGHSSFPNDRGNYIGNNNNSFKYQKTNLIENYLRHNIY